MLNQAILVGRLTTNPELKEEGEKKFATITLAIPRSYKNANGEYETDFITCILWNGIAENTSEYCKKGDIVGVKGRMQSVKVEKENGECEYKVEVIAEKVTFLSSRSKDDEKEAQED